MDTPSNQGCLPEVGVNELVQGGRHETDAQRSEEEHEPRMNDEWDRFE
jgi:hypothetical protein